MTIYNPTDPNFDYNAIEGYEFGSASNGNVTLEDPDTGTVYEFECEVDEDGTCWFSYTDEETGEYYPFIYESIEEGVDFNDPEEVGEFAETYGYIPTGSLDGYYD